MAKISREPRLGRRGWRELRGAPPPSAPEKGQIFTGLLWLTYLLTFCLRQGAIKTPRQKWGLDPDIDRDTRQVCEAS